MAAIPKSFIESQTVLAIYEAYEKANQPRFSRRLGASVIGMECPRAVWYSFRWAWQESFGGRTLRLFETGKMEEDHFADNLRSIGCEVHLIDPDTKQQIEKTAVAGHVVAKLDGVVLGIPEAAKTWHAVEFKTSNAKGFVTLRANGLKAAKPQHYAQLAIGMSLAGLDRGLYMSVNKDTDELYAERIRAEESNAPALLAFAEKIIRSSRAPERICSDPDGFSCKFCPFKAVCYGIDAPAVSACINCRTCCHSTPVMEGSAGMWKCEKHSKSISEAQQLAGCEDHIFIPDFITFADPSDGGEVDGISFVEYVQDGKHWRNSRAPGDYQSSELTKMPIALIVDDEMIAAAKKELGATVVEA